MKITIHVENESRNYSFSIKDGKFDRKDHSNPSLINDYGQILSNDEFKELKAFLEKEDAEPRE